MTLDEAVARYRTTEASYQAAHDRSRAARLAYYADASTFNARTVTRTNEAARAAGDVHDQARDQLVAAALKHTAQHPLDLDADYISDDLQDVVQTLRDRWQAP